MPGIVLPDVLMKPETLELLTRLLLEKESLRRSLKVRNFGPRVSTAEEAGSLFERVIIVSRDFLNLGGPEATEPKLVLTQRISRLPRMVFNMYLLLLPLSLLSLYATYHYSPGDAAVWVVRGAALSLLLLPLIMYRRSHLNIEHDCGYVRTPGGAAAMVIDQLPRMQFQSYLAHEYAHHLFYHTFGTKTQTWIREGWARLVQWRIMNILFGREENPAYLYHALDQIIGELKFACELISLVRKQRLPLRVRKIHTMYHRNPVLRLVTGTPGFRMEQLTDHAVGTACFLVAEHGHGHEWALQQGTLEWICLDKESIKGR